MTQATTRPEHDVSSETPPHVRGRRSAVAEPEPAAEPVILDDLLIEDVSIDGMCGVY